MNAGDEFTAQQALGEIGRVGREVRRSARWGARYLVALGVGVGLYWAIVLFADPGLSLVAALAWFAFTAWSVVYACRSRVYFPAFTRLQWIVTGFLLASTVFNMWIRGYVREGEGALPVLVGLFGIVFAAGPPLYGAWRGQAALGEDKGPVAAR